MTVGTGTVWPAAELRAAAEATAPANASATTPGRTTTTAPTPSGSTARKRLPRGVARWGSATRDACTRTPTARPRLYQNRTPERSHLPRGGGTTHTSHRVDCTHRSSSEPWARLPISRGAPLPTLVLGRRGRFHCPCSRRRTRGPTARQPWRADSVASAAPNAHRPRRRSRDEHRLCAGNGLGGTSPRRRGVR